MKCVTNVVAAHAQMISSPVCVQASITSNESSIMCVSLAGGYQEPGKDCSAGRSSPRSHGGGQGPAAGQQLH